MTMQLADRKKLIGFIAEIEASRDRAKGETRYQSETFKKAKEEGFDNKAMRKVLQRRAMSQADREQMDEAVDAYEHALGALALAREAVANGMSARVAAETYHVPRGALGVLTRGSENAISEPVHDDTTAEITPPSSGGEGCGPGATPTEVPNSPPQSDGCSTEEDTCLSGRDAPSDEHSKPRSLASDASDCTQPVEPTGNEGWAGERGPMSATGNQAHEGEGDGCENDSGRGKEPRDRISNSGREADRHGKPIEHDGRESQASTRGASPDRSSPGQLHVGALDPVIQGGNGAGASARDARLATSHGDKHGRRTESAGGDLLAPERDSVGASRGVDAPSTPPLGAIVEGDSPQRVASAEIDITIPPHLLRRPEARRA